jgi:CHAT domain-containing protein
MAKNGDPANAALVLERGRNRELRRRLEAEGEIEELPGLKIFDEALSDDFPLIYVDPTPFGTMLLRATRAQDDTRFDAIFLDRPTGMEVYRHFFLGDAAEATDPKEVLESGASYLLGVSLFEEDPLTSEQEHEQLEEKRVRQLRDGLDEIIPWLGETIAKAIAEAASDVGAEGVTLVPCGIVALAPLHAAEWSEGDGTHCLLDAFPVRYAPSALLLGLAISRAKERDEDEPHLVALADPCGDLEASVPEMEAIAARFHPDRSTFASGAEATTDFLRDHLSKATHVHLASHAQASLDTQQTGVQLADRFLPALDFDELGKVRARLIVVSACQGATQETAFRPDESFSVSTALLERGAACVIAALWPVDDRATALLMTRFYEEMIDQRVSPAVALGRAQIWMRGLSEQDASTFLAAYPPLEAVLRRQDTNGTEKRRGAGGAKLQAQARPFSHPDFWAAFVAVGV